MGKEVMGKKENEMAQEKERPAGSQSLFRGLMLIEILSNYPKRFVRWRIFRSWLV
ncbi:DNA-binding transcriptional repressor [Escherichia coli]|nr:DNA-binding transcriptional repressor [Escherichia coli]